MAIENKYLKVIYRDSGVNQLGENTVAIVQWWGVEPEKLLEAVTKAVTEYVKTTDAGREAWIRSCGTFNIGDLSDHLGGIGGTLDRLLRKEGVFGLEIEVWQDIDSQLPQWSYDLPLVDETKLPEGDPEDWRQQAREDE